MRRCGTCAGASACAVRSTIRSWNENSQALRGPRAGDTNPASTRLWMVLRGRRSSRSTSRTPYGCAAAGSAARAYFLAAFLGAVSACWARLRRLARLS